jgi:light-regulated signal transduction histidine kinase (bacteriophytochrome)
VTAEARREDLEPYLGRRYPASDIRRRRRLYIINTLRLIADTGYTPSPLRGRAGDAPLDLSHGVRAACRRSTSSICRTWASVRR